MSLGPLTRAVDDSRFVRGWRRLAAGSVVWRAAMRFGRSWSAGSSWIGQHLMFGDATRDFPKATNLIGAITVVAAVERFFLLTLEAWRQSRTKALLIDHTLSVLEPWERVRVIGWAVIVAVLTHTVVGFSSVMSSWREWVIGALALAAGVTLIAACKPFAVAWDQWRERMRF